MSGSRATPGSVVNTTTKRFAEVYRDDRFAVAALTLMLHPQVGRVGEVALLKDLVTRGRVSLSRLEPEFGRLTEDACGPLLDPFLSRKPVKIESVTEGGLRLSVSSSGLQVSVNGAPLERDRVIDAAALDRGTLIQLGGRVVLLLHRVTLPVERGPQLGLVGESDALEAVRRSVRRVADVDVPVLIRGETGTGKELIARAIAANSSRRAGPFVAVNMAAIPSAIAASELFGHAKGAFTGAVDDRSGYFADAQGGTLFLDEVGLAPPEVQAMLLRALETREVRPLGSRRARKVDVRFLAATDAELELLVAQGKFSEALLNRISGFQITAPPLRARREDVGRLVVYLLREELLAMGEGHRLDAPPEGQAPWFSADLMERLARASWPGNVRQLRNVVRQIVISSRGEPRARLDDGLLDEVEDMRPTSARPEADEHKAGTSRTATLKEIEKRAIREALTLHAGNQTRAAAALGMSRRTFCERIKLYGIPRPRT